MVVRDPENHEDLSSHLSDVLDVVRRLGIARVAMGAPKQLTGLARFFSWGQFMCANVKEKWEVAESDHLLHEHKLSGDHFFATFTEKVER